MLALQAMAAFDESGSSIGVALLGGGARAAYQVGVLTRVAEGAKNLHFPLIAGVSAGAANAVGVSGSANLEEAVEVLRKEWKRLDPAAIFDSFPSGRTHSIFGCVREAVSPSHSVNGTFLGFFDDRPIREFVSRCSNFDGIQANLAAGRLRAVALTASSYDTGKSVTFYQGQKDLRDWSRTLSMGVSTHLTVDHLMASGAIPLLFPPVRIGDGLYGDGNVRQQFPLAPLIHLGADRIFVVDPGPSRQSVQSRGPSRGTLADTMGLLLDSMIVDRIESDIDRLEEINERTGSEKRSWNSHPYRRIGLLLLRPSKDPGLLATALGPPRSRTLRFIIRAAGGWNERVAALMSYLWVDPRFTDQLFDLGYSDAQDRWKEIEGFLRPARESESSTTRVAG